MFNCHFTCTTHSIVQVYRNCVLIYLVFSCGWFALSLRKNNLPTFFFWKQFFTFADKTINFPPPFLLTAMMSMQYVQNKTLFLFVILLVCIYFCLRDNSLEMSFSISSKFCNIFFPPQSKVCCFFMSLQDACWWCEGLLLVEKALMKLLDIPCIFVRCNTLLLLVTVFRFQS